MSPEKDIARKTISAIFDRFPTLSFFEEDNPNVEISIVVPAQLGLKQEIWLGFQNRDELHFKVANFWLEWFPCTEPTRTQAFLDAVVGYISGEFRVVESHRGNKCIRALLEAPRKDGSWQTIGVWRCLTPPSLKKPTRKVIQNI